MSDKTFVRLVILIGIIGVLVTCAHLYYIVSSYPHSSIIYMISKEIW